MNNIQSEYFNYIVSMVSPKNSSYYELFRYLYSREFIAVLDRDNNRVADGIDFRYHFGEVSGYSSNDIRNYLDVAPCSVLEMMIALAFRCEESIMDDVSYGDRTSEWFWNMIINLELGPMDDNNFDVNYVSFIVDRLINRTYAPDGTGGLFTIHNKNRDLREVEIWYQLMWYLDENFSFSL